ncbi:putative hydrolase of the HAD superfamily [Chitinophaga costaii]|uniref:Putative hydrolase of the HAD superfamily n=1 Tax=Chitinophaga costaii TaxID=1335309 RepID=A0A1C4AKY2_9BACT|nr:HAD family phosphatase [Chitinophaga costaii]PUZ26650.1 HAD family phosphatase [Chitinophaga costaii]SCB95332.1 putative hydrolase of the HAD superfamily [Chitinophaga costaii]
MQGIRNIIFDLGGVILNIDYQRTVRAFKDLGFDHFEQLYSQFHLSELFDHFETGKISPEQFLEALQQQAPPHITREQLLNAWNAMLLDFPLARLQILQQLRQHYNLYLLSNTNALHYDAFNKILLESRGIPSLDTFFDRAYFSHIIGLRKPYAEAYQFVLDAHALKASETLFIDDTLPNITGAEAVGLRTLHLPGPKTILDIFKPLH